jgi:hypothetical protein
LIDEAFSVAQEKLFAQKFFTCYDGCPINQLEYLMDDNNHHIRVSSTDAVMTSTYDESTVWLTLVVERARASVIMTKEQAKELIDALQEVIA